jgi:hypothetical protein
MLSYLLFSLNTRRLAPPPPHERLNPHSLIRCLCSLPFPPGVATLEELKLNIAGHTLTVVAKIKLLDMVAELDLVSSLTPESDIRIRETCVSTFAFPRVIPTTHSGDSNVEPTCGSERIVGARAGAVVTHTVTLRHITHALCGGRSYEKGALKLPQMGSEVSAHFAPPVVQLCPVPLQRIHSALCTVSESKTSLMEVRWLICQDMMDEAALRLKETPMPENLVQQALTRATPMLQALSEGFEVPLSGTFDRSMLVSYLDKDLMVARALNGSPEVCRSPPP